MSDLLTLASSQAKDFTTLVAAVSAIAYAIGFLAVRTRSFVLGIEPGTELVSAAYVFAGFRFLFATGFFLLLLAVPAIICTQLVRISVPHGPLAWTAVTALATATVTLFAFLTQLQGILLSKDSRKSFLWAGGFAFALSLLATALASAAFIWLAATASALRAGEALPILLALIAALQGLLLPMLHGAFYADRTVRELAVMPDGLQGLQAPIWLIERNKDRVALFAWDVSAAPILLSLPSAKIDGIPVVRLARLSEMLGVGQTAPETSRNSARVTLAAALLILGGSQAIAQTPTPRTNESFLRLTWSSLRAIPELLGSLGESGVDAGEIWEYRLTDGHRQRISHNNDLAWPIRLQNGMIVALQNRRAVSLNAGGEIGGQIGPAADWRKLLGVSPDGEILGIIGYDTPRPAVMTASGMLETLPEPATTEEREQLQILLMESRRYQIAVIRVGGSERGGRGTDIYLEKDGATQNISDCGVQRCGQAVLTPDGSAVLYVVAKQ